MRFFREISRTIGLLALALGACAQLSPAEGDDTRPRVGLFTTLPIFWGEGDISSLIEGSGEPDWVRTELEKRFQLVPLDTLEPEALADLDRVILAQPRPLAPSENVSFDNWVANGGTALILADPMLTRHSAYPLGDKRRPQDVVLLSPILARWGLAMVFDEHQRAGEHEISSRGQVFPVNRAGRFEHADADAVANCTIRSEPVFAQCSRGAGRAFLFADAAILDGDEDGILADSRKEALSHLIDPLAQ